MPKSDCYPPQPEDNIGFLDRLGAPVRIELAKG